MADIENRDVIGRKIVEVIQETVESDGEWPGGIVTRLVLDNGKELYGAVIPRTDIPVATVRISV